MLDFGKGFYTTTSQEEAEKWALIKKKREDNNSKAIVSIYEIDHQLLTNMHYNIKIFYEANEEWLDFIVENRNNYSNHAFDIVKGVVANDTLYRTLSLYESGVFSKLETIKRLKILVLFDQISFHNHSVLKELIYTEFYEL